MTQLAIDMPCSDRPISPGVPGAAGVIFANHRDQHACQILAILYADYNIQNLLRLVNKIARCVAGLMPSTTYHVT